MCFNCEIYSPITNEICELLGIPKQVYGTHAYPSLDILKGLLLNIDFAFRETGLKDINKYKCLFKGERREKDTLLFDYLKKNDLLHYIEDHIQAQKPDYAGIAVNRCVNYVIKNCFTVTIEEIDVEEFKGTLRVPIELLSSNPKNIGDSIKKVKYTQVKEFPSDSGINLKRAKDHGIILLDNNTGIINRILCYLLT